MSNNDPNLLFAQIDLYLNDLKERIEKLNDPKEKEYLLNLVQEAKEKVEKARKATETAINSAQKLKDYNNNHLPK
jgi:vacuolar-type H+-ATPase subunit E/Vma4